MSNPEDKIRSSLGINGNDLTSEQARIICFAAYDNLEQSCKEKGIELDITQDQFFLDYENEHEHLTLESVLDYIYTIGTCILAAKVDPSAGQLGFVVNPATVAGTIAGTTAMANIITGRKLGQSKLQILKSSLLDDLTAAGVDGLTQAASLGIDKIIGDISGGILGRGGPQGPAGGGGGRGQTFGGTGNIQPIGSNFANHVHPTVKLSYNLGIEGTTRGTDPFDSQLDDDTQVIHSCLTIKLSVFRFPTDEDFFNSYYSKVWIPQIRDYLQGEKRLNTNLSLLVTADRMKKYIERVGKALQVYHFFTNVFNYNQLGGGLNTNQGLRYLREDMFSTTNLQKLGLLRERLDGLPWPQTLDSEIAYHSLIYTQSDVPYSGYRMVAPDIFEGNTHATNPGWANVITTLKSDIIQQQLDGLDFYGDTDRENIFKMIGAI